MENLYTKINQAKEELGTQAAAIIATELPIENWNAEKLSRKRVRMLRWATVYLLDW